MIGRLQPHDLVRIDGSQASSILVAEDAAAWPSILACLQRAPWAVVRRARKRRGMIPVGIRGMERSQRFAAWLDPRGIGYVMAPETLRATDEVRAMPVFAALRELERRMSSSPYPWGPTGSTGFELASGTPMVNPASDLDILLRSKTRLSHQDAQSIMDRCVDLTCAVDIQIETPHGAFALREFLNGDGRVLLRACGGPILVDDPWQLPALCKQLPAVCKMSA